MSERQNHNEDDDSLDVKASNIYSGGEISGYSPTWRVINPSSSHQEEINNTGNNNLNGKYTIPWYGKHLNFWGHPSKKWYKSPVLLGSSLISIFLIMLISVPALGVISIPYPDTSISTYSFHANHESITSNFLVFNSEYLSKGNTINYSIHSDVPVSFIISTQPINLFPRMNNITGINSINLFLPSAETYNYQYYLFAGDKITYSFSSNGSIQLELLFSIFDPENVLNNGYSNSYGGIIENASSTFTATSGGFLTLSLKNLNSFSNLISGSIHYSLSSYNISQANVHLENITNESNSYKTPITGEYYFSILDSNPNLVETANINNTFTPNLTYEIDYHQNLTANERWLQLSPFLIELLLITSIILITGFFQRKKAILLTKNINITIDSINNEKEQTNIINKNIRKIKKPSVQNEQKNEDCIFCGRKISHEDSYCTFCGRRII